jgi:hypothetical protein
MSQAENFFMPFDGRKWTDSIGIQLLISYIFCARTAVLLQPMIWNGGKR